MNSKRGKIFYFVGMTIAIIMVIVFFTLFLLSILNAGIFMPEFSSYEYLLLSIEDKQNSINHNIIYFFIY